MTCRPKEKTLETTSERAARATDPAQDGGERAAQLVDQGSQQFVQTQLGPCLASQAEAPDFSPRAWPAFGIGADLVASQQTMFPASLEPREDTAQGRDWWTYGEYK